MTVRDSSLENKSKKLELVDNIKVVLSNKGVTREQLLLKDLKIIAKDYLDIEEIKKSFSRIILKNLKELDFSSFNKFPRFYIKEDSIKKSVSPSNIRGLNVVSVDGSSVTKKFMNVDFSFLKAI
ncbi:MAG: hypothetical protein KAX18_09580, partial [Candidatus Lokiarchaeota archaeon]|nr:hypothetical protein [Candidatus Lokiarchaeota archaeon]